MGSPQMFACPDCGARFGPFGVAPFDPHAEKNQAWLACRRCKQPFMQLMGKGDRARCTRCDTSDETVPLRACPSCESEKATWVPVL
ncbi:MAG: hypothetical protein AB7S26_05590 [Sandaracinaceae bacterium]